MLGLLNELADVSGDLLELLLVLLVLSLEGFYKGENQENCSLETQIVLAVRYRKSQEVLFD